MKHPFDSLVRTVQAQYHGNVEQTPLTIVI